MYLSIKQAAYVYIVYIGYAKRRAKNAQRLFGAAPDNNRACRSAHLHTLTFMSRICRVFNRRQPKPCNSSQLIMHKSWPLTTEMGF